MRYEDVSLIDSKHFSASAIQKQPEKWKIHKKRKSGQNSKNEGKMRKNA